MKKSLIVFTALLLSAICLASLVGCGDTSAVSSDDGSPSSVSSEALSSEESGDASADTSEVSDTVPPRSEWKIIDKDTEPTDPASAPEKFPKTLFPLVEHYSVDGEIVERLEDYEYSLHALIITRDFENLMSEYAGENVLYKVRLEVGGRFQENGEKVAVTDENEYQERLALIRSFDPDCVVEREWSEQNHELPLVVATLSAEELSELIRTLGAISSVSPA